MLRNYRGTSENFLGSTRLTLKSFSSPSFLVETGVTGAEYTEKFIVVGGGRVSPKGKIVMIKIFFSDIWAREFVKYLSKPKGTVRMNISALRTKINLKILKTTLLRTSRNIQNTKENCYFGSQVSVPNPNSLCAPYTSTCSMLSF